MVAELLFLLVPGGEGERECAVGVVGGVFDEEGFAGGFYGVGAGFDVVIFAFVDLAEVVERDGVGAAGFGEVAEQVERGRLDAFAATDVDALAGELDGAGGCGSVGDFFAPVLEGFEVAGGPFFDSAIGLVAAGAFKQVFDASDLVIDGFEALVGSECFEGGVDRAAYDAALGVGGGAEVFGFGGGGFAGEALECVFFEVGGDFLLGADEDFDREPVGEVEVVIDDGFDDVGAGGFKGDLEDLVVEQTLRAYWVVGGVFFAHGGFGFAFGVGYPVDRDGGDGPDGYVVFDFKDEFGFFFGDEDAASVDDLPAYGSLDEWFGAGRGAGGNAEAFGGGVDACGGDGAFEQVFEGDRVAGDGASLAEDGHDLWFQWVARDAKEEVDGAFAEVDVGGAAVVAGFGWG